MKRAKYFYLDHGFYGITAKLAREIAGGQLPTRGKERLVPTPHDFRGSKRGYVWLSQTQHDGRPMWAIRDSGDWVLRAGRAVMEARSNPPTRVRVGRKKVPLSEATLSQLQIAALKAFPSSPYQLEIRAEINRRHERGEKTWTPPEKKSRRRNPLGGGRVWEYEDSRGVVHRGHLVSYSDFGGTDVPYTFKDEKTGEVSVVSGQRLKRAKIVISQNPRRRRNPELRDVRSVGSNMIEAHHGSLHVLYSYKTPVAILAPSGLYKTDKFHSRTTSGHIAKWFRSWNLDPKGALALPQSVIEQYAENGVDPVSQRGAERNPITHRTALKYAKALVTHERAGVREKNAPRQLSVPERHQLRIARDNFKNPAKARFLGGPTPEESREIITRLTGRDPGPPPVDPRLKNPRRRTGRTLKRKKIASSYKRQRYEFFRKPSHGGLEKPAATAQHAKELADAERWAYDQGVDYLYYYGADAGYEEEGDEWQGRVEAVHPNGATADAYGYLGDDWNQSHVRAEAALALMRDFKARNPAHGGRKVVRIRKRARVTVRGGLRRKENPAIGILGNPPHDGKYLGKVTYIEYTHGHDGQRYYHDFKPAVYAQVMDDGGVRLWHPTNKLWKLFPEPK